MSLLDGFLFVIGILVALALVLALIAFAGDEDMDWKVLLAGLGFLALLYFIGG